MRIGKSLNEFLINSLVIKTNIYKQVHESKRVFYAEEITNRTVPALAINKHFVNGSKCENTHFSFLT